MKKYKIYNITIDSEIEFFETEELPEDTVCDCTLRFGMPPEQVIKAYKEKGDFGHVEADSMWFRLEDKFLIYVRNGNEVLVWKMDDSVNENELHTFVLQGAFTFLLFQRGYTLVHGSALVHNGKCFIVSGASGSGKSTTAVNILKRPGYLFASDDICPVKIVGDECMLFPGPPWQKMCTDVMEKETEGGVDTSAYVFLEEAGGKFGKRLEAGYVTEPVRLDSIFIIQREEDGEAYIEKKIGIDSLMTLSCNLFRGEILNESSMRTPERMYWLTQIVAKTNIYVIHRPIGMDTTEAVMNMITERI